MQPSVAVVILNWNGRKYLEKFLPSVLATQYDNVDIIVADNGSTDESLSFLNAAFPEVKTIALPINYGFARGYNEALKQIDADYYMLLNSDVEVTPGWLTPMIDLLESDKTIAGCQPKVLSYKNRSCFDYAGAAGGWIDSFGYPFGRGRIFDIIENDEGQYDSIAPIFWASGAALCIRSHVYNEMFGFDNYFFAHQEEIDLCWRIQIAGYKIYSCPTSVIYHLGGGTLPRGNSRKTYLNFRNNLIMLWKNLPLSERWWKLAFRVVLDVTSALKGLLSGDPGYFVAIFRAHLAFLSWLFRYKKMSVFPPKRKPVSVGVYKGNLVWQHFVKGRKSFREIVK